MTARPASLLAPLLTLGLLTLTVLTGCAPTQTLNNPSEVAATTLTTTQPTTPNASPPTAEQATLFAGTYQVLGDAQAASTPRQLTLRPVAGSSAVQGYLTNRAGQSYALSGSINMQGPSTAQLQANIVQASILQGGTVVGTLSASLTREGQQVTLQGQYMQDNNTRHLYSYKALSAGASAAAPQVVDTAAVNTTQAQVTETQVIETQPINAQPSQPAPTISKPAQPKPVKTQPISTSIPVFVTPTPGPLPK